jgi:TM2 domain-containing membrane protein YozV
MSYAHLPPGPVNPHLIDAMVASSKRDLFRAYMFWNFGGVFGIHNFYLGKPVLGALQAGSLPIMAAALHLGKWIGFETIGGMALGVIGIAILAGLALSLLIDPFLIPARARAYLARRRAELEADWQSA